MLSDSSFRAQLVQHRHATFAWAGLRALNPRSPPCTCRTILQCHLYILSLVFVPLVLPCGILPRRKPESAAGWTAPGASFPPVFRPVLARCPKSLALLGRTLLFLPLDWVGCGNRGSRVATRHAEPPRGLTCSAGAPTRRAPLALGAPPALRAGGGRAGLCY